MDTCSSKTISAEIIIQNASIDSIWTVLTDFDKYSEWNEFFPKVEVIGIGNGNGDSSEYNTFTATPKVGDKVILHVQWIGSNNTFQQEVMLKEFDAVNKRLAWGGTIGLPFLFQAVRVQTLEVVDGQSVKYTASEDFRGILVPLMMMMHGNDIQNGFDHIANGLKTRSENLNQ